MRFPLLSLVAATLISTASLAEESIVPVTLENFARAATEIEFANYLPAAGGVNKWYHVRRPITAEEQMTIRFNLDVIFSVAVIDISQGATLTMPETAGRYQSAMVINQDHYINKVFHGAGTHQLDKATFDTDYVIVAIRTLIDAADPYDVAQANALQDQLRIDANAARPFVLPNYDMEAFGEILDATLKLATYAPDSFRTFGHKDFVDPVRHFIGTGYGWGGLPEQEAFYLTVTPQLPNAQFAVEAPAEVPVGAFWSLTVYDDRGYLLKDAGGRHKVSSIDSVTNTDGSVTVHLGGCDDGRANCLPITENWTYVVRMYQPSQSILDGSWKFPDPVAVQ